MRDAVPNRYRKERAEKMTATTWVLLGVGGIVVAYLLVRTTRVVYLMLSGRTDEES